MGKNSKCDLMLELVDVCDQDKVLDEIVGHFGECFLFGLGAPNHIAIEFDEQSEKLVKCVEQWAQSSSLIKNVVQEMSRPVHKNP